MRLSVLLTTAAVAALFPNPLLAQNAQDDDNEIVVVAERYRGQLDVPQAPIVQLEEADIAAYGASSIEELVQALAPETGSARGRGGGGQPVFLINGIRIGSFREFSSYPPEAIKRLEVLPEETAQLFGFPPDRRVVNFILKDDYSAITAAVELEQPDRGGYSYNEQELTLLKIAGGGRLNLDIQANDTSLLTERERGVIQNPSSIPDIAGDPDPAGFRSLVSDSRELEATANWAKAIIDSGSSISLNATANRTDTRGLFGLDTVLLSDPAGNSALRTLNKDDPLERRSRTETYSSAATYTAPLGDFRLTATADASLTDTNSEIDQRAGTADLLAAAAAGTLAIDSALPELTDGGFAIADARTYTAETKVTARGAPVILPAGELSTTFDLGYKWNRIESSDTRSALDTQLTRGRINGGVNVVVPIASRRENAWAGIGDLSLNLQAGIDRLSDFGTLYDWSAGLTWKPFENLDLQATYVNAEAAPSLTQLGAATVTTFNVPVFDFINGDTVLASVTSGGNQALVEESQSDWKFSANWELPFIKDTRFQVDYIRNRSDDVSVSFPLLTPEIEAAFPGRVTRDAGGNLVAIDQRPITFSQTLNDRISFGLSSRGQFGKTPDRQAGRQAGRPGGRPGGRGGEGAGEGARGGAGRPGGGGNPMAMFGGGGDSRGRYFVSLNHQIELKNKVVVAPGGPVLDLLGGDALSGNGSPRHSTTLEGGMFKSGYGLRLSGRYSGSSRVDGSGLPGSTDLQFGDVATIDIRMFADLGRAFDKDSGPLKGLRLAVKVDNVFDARRRVTDENGDVPLSYQPFLIDPVGRYIGIDIRKLF
ncbi:TonB-dependent receptor [Altererythrobacter aquiaggeris]|uniref:TonB-dependent receptor n=1 Tax=Aestuarierythrobacter aquiaggeris TaxID=1898396 RepID=UPI00301AB695